MQPNEIKALIEAHIADSDVKTVEVQGDHIGVVIVSSAFAGLSPVKKQQLVMGALAEQFANRTIHAIDYIKAFTPDEWAAKA
jgi:acid stress-induced BolA-like protein IbaG/YrbA